MREKRKMLMRIVSGFFVFYLISMGIITGIQQWNYREQTVAQVVTTIDGLAKDMIYPLTNYHDLITSADEAVKIAQEDRYGTIFTERLDWLTARCSRDNDGGVYVEGALYTEGQQFIAESGSHITYTYMIPRTNSQFPSIEVYGAIDLESLLSQEKLIELYHYDGQMYSDKYQGIEENAIFLKLKGQLDDQGEKPVIIPTQIVVSQGEEVVANYSLNPRESELGEEVELHLERSYFQDGVPLVGRRVFDEREMYKYEQCADVGNPDFFKRLNRQMTLDSVEHSFFYTEYNRIAPVYSSNEDKFYLATSAVIYPWQVAMEELKPVYIANLILVIILSWIIWRKFIQIHDQQKKNEENRKRLTDGIAHEIKTPLGVIRSYSEGLQEKIAEEKRDRYLQVIIDEVDEIDQLVIKMLELSKLEEGQHTVNREEINIGDLVELLRDKLGKLFEDQNKEIRIQQDGLVTINGDRQLMERAISNLLINALEHTEAGGEVFINIGKDQLSIENKGELIPQEHLPYVWDVFYRVDSNRNRKLGGTGIGLAVVKQCLEAQGMAYGVKNISNGVRFWIKFDK